MIRERLPTALEPWPVAVVKSRVLELASFARGWEKDKGAVPAALLLPWSNGQVKG